MRNLAIPLVAAFALLTAALPASQASAQTSRSNMSVKAAARNYTPVEKTACQGWGPWCPPGYVRACGPFGCFCRPCS